MQEFMFRNLEADEIEVRVSEVKDWGVSLLLYKNARCDMAILDEVLSPMGWQREHYECKGNLFCRVGIRDKETGEWVWKSDAGKASNFESEKGESSDSFKRACTNWGIGRELYTAPRIVVRPNQANVKQNNNGKLVCYDRFSVAKIVIEQHVICCIAVKNDATGHVVFTWIREGYKPETRTEIPVYEQPQTAMKEF